MKKSHYKIGDKVTVFFLGSVHESEIIEIKQHPSNHENLIFTTRDVNGLIIPYVGLEGSERFANILSNSDLKSNIKNKQNDINQSKRKNKQNLKKGS